MRKILYCCFAALLVLSGGVALAPLLSEFQVQVRSSVPSVQTMAVHMNVHNMVSAIYLGPRLFDTFLEVLIVILTVYGIKYIRSQA